MLDRFDLDDHQTLDEKIEPIETVHHDTLVHNGKSDLAFDFEPSESKLIDKAGEVHAFQKSRTEGSMDLYRRFDDPRK